MSHPSYSEKETEELIEMYSQTKDVKEIARLIGRNHISVRTKLVSLDLYDSSYNWGQAKLNIKEKKTSYQLIKRLENILDIEFAPSKTGYGLLSKKENMLKILESLENKLNEETLD